MFKGRMRPYRSRIAKLHDNIRTHGHPEPRPSYYYEPDHCLGCGRENISRSGLADDPFVLVTDGYCQFCTGGDRNGN